MIISLDAEKTLNKMKQELVIKVLENLEIQGYSSM